MPGYKIPAPPADLVPDPCRRCGRTDGGARDGHGVCAGCTHRSLTDRMEWDRARGEYVWQSDGTSVRDNPRLDQGAK